MSLDEEVKQMHEEVKQLCRTVNEMSSVFAPGKHDLNTKEVAQLMGRSEYQVRAWCRTGRVNAIRSTSKCGNSNHWIIPYDAYLFLRSRGLLPIRRA